MAYWRWKCCAEWISFYCHWNDLNDIVTMMKDLYINQMICLQACLLSVCLSIFFLDHSVKCYKDIFIKIYYAQFPYYNAWKYTAVNMKIHLILWWHQITLSYTFFKKKFSLILEHLKPVMSKILVSFLFECTFLRS